MKTKIYNRIKTYRVDRGVTRKDLAKRIGVNFQTIGYLERGDYNPTLEVALRLAEYFEVKVDDLFSLRPFRNLSD